MMLDGTAVSAGFDSSLDMGIVGTTAGTLWYVNWSDNSSIRLVSGHKTKVSDRFEIIKQILTKYMPRVYNDYNVLLCLHLHPQVLFSLFCRSAMWHLALMRAILLPAARTVV